MRPTKHPFSCFCTVGMALDGAEIIFFKVLQNRRESVEVTDLYLHDSFRLLTPFECLPFFISRNGGTGAMTCSRSRANAEPENTSSHSPRTEGRCVAGSCQRPPLPRSRRPGAAGRGVTPGHLCIRSDVSYVGIVSVRLAVSPGGTLKMKMCTKMKMWTLCIS